MVKNNRKILRALADMPHGARRADLEKMLGMGSGYVRALDDYRKRELISRSGSKGAYLYMITDAGRAYLSNSENSRPTDKTHCEVWTGSRWEIWSVLAAYEVKHIMPVRCYECHGPIVLMRPSSDGRNRAHFEHKPAHEECRLVHRGRLNLAKEAPIPVSAPSTSDSAFLDYMPDSVVDAMIEAATDYRDDDSQKDFGSAESTSGPTEREQLRRARVGQGKFREGLKKRWGSCGVLRCGPMDVLVASHIHAWRLCETNKDRLDVDNGILLSPNLDKLFDRRFISFAPDGMLLVAERLTESDMMRLGLHRGMNLHIVHPGMKPFLKRHRANEKWIYFSHESCRFDEANFPD